MGVEKITITELKNNIDCLAKMIKTVINHAIKYNGTPNTMKIAIILIIYKKGSLKYY